MGWIWYIIGIALLCWVGYDILAGYTYLHRVILRDEEPVFFWSMMLVWVALAISCFWG